ncbi:MAG: rhomboid family intramembrane serine protease [Flavobacteriales bacterium]|nr:rhomboid family intramembrane serine protease [Flavobacteriales bacterium]
MMVTLTLLIIIITAIVSVLAFSNIRIFDQLKFNAFMIRHNLQVWRFITGALVHADILHLAMNMYVLYIFGTAVENHFLLFYEASFKGPLFYLLLYVGGAVLSCLYSFEKHKDDLWYNAVGASGAVSAVVFAFIAIRPDQHLQLIFLPGINIPAFLLGALYLIYSWLMAKNKSDNISHDTHFFGALFGFLYVFILQPELFPQFIKTIIHYILR